MVECLYILNENYEYYVMFLLNILFLMYTKIC